MTFEIEFENWLKSALKNKVPDNVKAFSFNIFEPAFVKGVKFGIEVIGASEFNPDDADWACSEVWEPEQRNLNIPSNYSSENWEVCLNRIKILLLKLLEKNDSYIKELKNKEAIGIGFVDGSLEILNKP